MTQALHNCSTVFFTNAFFIIWFYHRQKLKRAQVKLRSWNAGGGEAGLVSSLNTQKQSKTIRFLISPEKLSWVPKTRCWYCFCHSRTITIQRTQPRFIRAFMSAALAPASGGAWTPSTCSTHARRAGESQRPLFFKRRFPEALRAFTRRILALRLVKVCT